MKISSHLLFHAARYLRRKRTYKDAALALAALYGINEVFGIPFTLSFLFDGLWNAVTKLVKKGKK